MCLDCVCTDSVHHCFDQINLNLYSQLYYTLDYLNHLAVQQQTNLCMCQGMYHIIIILHFDIH